MKAFITKTEPATVYEERLFTIASAHVISAGSKEVDFLELLNQRVKAYRGKIVQFGQEGFTTLFDGPSKAVHCCLDIKKLFNAHQM